MSEIYKEKPLVKVVMLKGQDGEEIIVDRHTGSGLGFWTGTREEFEAIPEEELVENCIYYLTDDTRDDFRTDLNALDTKVDNNYTDLDERVTDLDERATDLYELAGTLADETSRLDRNIIVLETRATNLETRATNLENNATPIAQRWNVTDTGAWIANGSYIQYVKRNGFCTVTFYLIIYFEDTSSLSQRRRVYSQWNDNANFSLPIPIGNSPLAVLVSTSGKVTILDIPMDDSGNIMPYLNIWGGNTCVVNGDIVAGTITYACK